MKSTGSTASTQPVNVFLFPATNKNNAYIKLFRQSVENAGERISVVGVKDEFLPNILPYIFFGKTRRAKNIVHIHWPTVLYGSRLAMKSLVLMLVNFSLLFFLRYFLGFKIVWTVHNFSAHDYPHPRIDKIGQSMTRWLAHAIIVQQKSILTLYQKKYPHKNIFYIPHGNYIGVYGPMVSPDMVLKKSLGFSEGDKIIISFGAVAPYKLNEKIIEVFNRSQGAQKSFSNLKLLIVGKGRSEYVDSLAQLTKDNPNVVIKNVFVEDRDVSKYFSIADCTIFYYDHSEMTSGAMILSLSYGVPVITRNISAAEIVGEKNGLVFGDDADLESAFEKIEELIVVASRHDIMENMKQYSWSSVANDTVRVYENK